MKEIQYRVQDLQNYISAVDLAELKTLKTPPVAVVKVMTALLMIFGTEQKSNITLYKLLFYEGTRIQHG